MVYFSADMPMFVKYRSACIDKGIVFFCFTFTFLMKISGCHNLLFSVKLFS